MYLHIGQDYILNTDDILGIFDLDNTSTSVRTREFLARAEKEGAVIPLNDELPRSFILYDGPAATTLYLSPLSGRTLAKRAEDPIRSFKPAAKEK